MSANEREIMRLARDVPQAPWDALLTTDDLFLSWRWLQVAEATAHAPMRYALLRAGDGLQAGVPTALATATSPWVLGRPDHLLVEAARAGDDAARSFLADLDGGPADLLPSLVCGGRHMGRSRLPHRAERSDGPLLLERCREIAAELGARSISFPFVSDDDATLRAWLEQEGVRSHPSGRYSWLPLPPGGLDGYLSALPGKRRRRAQADRRQLATAGVRSALRPLLPGDFARLATLETNLMHKYGVSWRPEQTEASLTRIAAVFGDDALVSYAEADGELRGFVVLLRWRDAWFTRQTGFDYAYQSGLPLYFEVMYYRPAEEAVAAGVRSIHYGMGSEEAKASRGCQAVTQHHYFQSLS